jgi:AbrB family looped-hinge helix DNA binding protein
MKTGVIHIDKAGRVALPKPLRDQLNLVPGDQLRATVEGNSVRLEPTAHAGTLIREGRMLVVAPTGQPLTSAEVEEMIRRDRADRLAPVVKRPKR